ncbi:MAG: hypothetical protein V6Z82_05940 [Flavobacteriales bacterium]
MKEGVLNIVLPLFTGGISWIATRWWERRKFKAEAVSAERGNDRSEIENYKLIATEWREAAQKWKDLVDEYQTKLIDNSHRIDELSSKLSATTRELSLVKGQLTKAQNRIKELEKHNL